jgi:hypothetical protein
MELGDQLISRLLLHPEINSKNYHFGVTAATENLLQDPTATRPLQGQALLAIDTCSQLSAASVV